MELEMKINSERVKQLRNQQSWSQDQLASVSGLSLRTIQRIENRGACALDSKRALAAVFEVGIDELTITESDSNFFSFKLKGRNLGYLGSALGVLCAFSGISLSLINGYMSYEAAGIYFGSVGAVGGICCAAIGVLSNKHSVCCNTDCFKA
jgi:transcriptional regulator with XRE-family HTH domain